MKIGITREELFLEFTDSLKLKNDKFFDKLIDFINYFLVLYFKNTPN